MDIKTILINGSEIEIESIEIKAGIKDIVELMDENDIDLLDLIQYYLDTDRHYPVSRIIKVLAER